MLNMVDSCTEMACIHGDRVSRNHDRRSSTVDSGLLQDMHNSLKVWFTHVPVLILPIYNTSVQGIGIRLKPLARRIWQEKTTLPS